jgi:Flp pilus assembly protein TadG
MGASAAPQRPPHRRGFRRFLRDRRGALGLELVEFALIGPVFLALLGAIIETSLAFWAGVVMDNALADAARQLYTGQFQKANAGTTDSATLLTKLRTDAFCKVDGQARTTVFTCSDVKMDVRKVAQFSSSGANSPVSGGNWSSGFGSNYTSAGAGDIMVVQAAVKYPVFFTLWNPNQGSFSDGSRLIQSSVVFRTEPY